MKHYKIELLFLLFFSLTPLLWLRDGEIIIGHDTGYYLDALERIRTYLYSWLPTEGFGADYSIYRGFLVTLLPETFFALITGSLAWGQRLSFIFWFFVMGISMYSLAKYLLPGKRHWPFRLIASTYYVYNFFILQAWMIAERAKFSIYAALPLITLILLKLYRRELSLPAGAMLFGFTLFILNGGGSPPLYGSVSLLIAAFLLASLAGGFRSFLRSVKIVLVCGLSFIVINFYWLLPVAGVYLRGYTQALGESGGLAGVTDWASVISVNSSLVNLLRLQALPDWVDNPQHPYASWYSNTTAFLLSFIPIAVIFAGLVTTKFTFRHKKDMRFLVTLLFALLALGLFFSKGTQPPFGGLYTYMLRYIPGFAMFRTPVYKFGSVVWFSVVLIFAYYVNYFLLKIRSKILANGLSVLAISLILAYHWPYFQGEFFKWSTDYSTKLKVPEYVYDISKYADKKYTKEIRVFALPVPDNPPLDTYDWGFYSLDNLPKSSLYRSIVLPEGALAEAIEAGVVAQANSLMKVYSVNKILLRKDSTADSASLKQFLDSNYKPDYHSGEWFLYDTGIHVPKIQAANGIVTTNSNAVEVMLLEPGNQTVTDTNAIPEQYTEKVLKAECAVCNFNYGMKPYEFLHVPLVRHKPGTLSYRLMRYQEKRALSKADNIPQKIDLLLLTASRRLAEEDFNEYLLDLEMVSEYFGRIGEKEAVYYSTRIIGYLDSHTERIHDEAALDIINTHRRFYEGFEWRSEDYEHIKMLLPVENTGDYMVTKDTDVTLLLDGEAVQGNLATLEQRLHRVEVQRTRPDNLLTQGLGPIVLEEQAYLLTFTYTSEEKPVFRAGDDEFELYEGQARKFSYLFTGGGEFTPEIEGARVEDVNLSVFNLPEIYFRKPAEQFIDTPEITSRRISPVKYEIEISATDKPFALVLSQSYNPHWKLSTEASHFKADGYANGWYLDKWQGGKMELYYAPQRLYDLGTTVSAGALIVAFVILVRKYKPVSYN